MNLFDTVLVANRGEIAVRVMRTLRDLGITSVAVYSDADADAVHVKRADIAVRIGPAAARDSYLSIDAVIGAGLDTGAQAIHPGYGFLSENAAFAGACAEAGIVFIGPPASAIEAMGDKIAAKATVAAAGVPVVPGSDGAGLDDEAIRAAAIETGFPVLLKPSAGGGGKGMRLVEREAGLDDAIASARREARNSFGDDTLLVERFITSPRHIEIQVMADNHGDVVHLGERECSLQRRHQKIVEEAPSPLLTPATRAEMGRQAVEAARACGYSGAGTVEFIVSGDRSDEFFFMEMNTRLQVEHPVTEMVFGVDLVEEQIRVAAGERLRLRQDDLEIHGHAVEARLYAEDPDRQFLPTGGTIVGLREAAGEGVRVDSGIAVGTVVGSDYDPMLAKVITWAPDRHRALRRLDAALAATSIAGVTTNVGFLRRLLALDAVATGDLDTELVDRVLDDITGADVPIVAIAAATLAPMVGRGTSPDPWQALTGWRHGGAAGVRREFDIPVHGPTEVVATPVAGGWRVTSGGAVDRHVAIDRLDEHRWRISLEGRATTVDIWDEAPIVHVVVGGESHRLTELDGRGAGAHGEVGAADGVVRSPMPGTVISVAVEVGDTVAAGQTVAIVEAMKMEHALPAPFDGVVASITSNAGTPVVLDQPIVAIEPSEPSTESSAEPSSGSREPSEGGAR